MGRRPVVLRGTQGQPADRGKRCGERLREKSPAENPDAPRMDRAALEWRPVSVGRRSEVEQRFLGVGVAAARNDDRPRGRPTPRHRQVGFGRDDRKAPIPVRGPRRRHPHAHNEQPDAGAHNVQPDAGAHNEQPDAGAHNEQPDAGAHNVQPDAGAHNEQPDAGAHNEQPDAGALIGGPAHHSHVRRRQDHDHRFNHSREAGGRHHGVSVRNRCQPSKPVNLLHVSVHV
mmetsp:Transcript_4979/g.9072  ORF Transcript_4979/g.9072 Transcript_4979/m.9072 type:complete len:229 (-) Transcript_4979:504-1190(-)